MRSNLETVCLVDLYVAKTMYRLKRTTIACEIITLSGFFDIVRFLCFIVELVK